MLLDARKGDSGWDIWDVRRCMRPTCVVWVDDEAACWGQWKDPNPRRINGEILTRREERIVIVPEKKMIWLNPVQDDDAKDDEWQDTIPVGEATEVEAEIVQEGGKWRVRIPAG